jgi:hypothetical protein
MKKRRANYRLIYFSTVAASLGEATFLPDFSLLE